MRSREIARRYGEALYSLAREEEKVDRVDGDYKKVLAGMAEVTGFGKYLVHPLVPKEKKNELIERSFPNITEFLGNLFSLVVRNGREGYIDLIYDEFVAVRAEEEGTTWVVVTSARELTKDDRRALSARLAETLGAKIRIKERIERDLLGGVKIEVDGKVLDGSLRARLDGLRALMEG